MNKAELIKVIAEEIAKEMFEHIEASELLTYGEVMKAVLGIKDEQIIKGEHETVIRLKRDSDSFMSFDSKVWDSTYKGVGE